MKKYWVRLHKIKKLGLVLLSLIFTLFFHHGLQPYISGYIAYKKSNATAFIQIKLHEPEVKSLEPIDPIEISMASLEQLKHFATNDYNSPTFEQDGNQYEIVYNGTEISHLQLSSDQKKLGFYLHFPEEDTVFGRTALVIMDIAKRNFKEISEGDLKVSNWEWRNNNQAIIYINCGSGCHLAHVRSITDGKLLAEYLDR